MSTIESNAEDRAVTEEHEKDVVITAYADSEYDDKREFIDDVLGDQCEDDVLEMETREERTVELVCSVEGESEFGTKEITESIAPFSSSDQDALADALQDKEIPDWLEFVNKTEEIEKHACVPKTPIDAFIRNTIPEDTLDGLGYEHSKYGYVRSWSKSVEDTSADADMGDTINHDVRFNARSTGISERQTLVHQSERSKSNQYESEDEHWSFEVKIHFEAGSGSGLDNVSELLVQPMYQALFGLDGISAVRLTACEQNVSRTGECYNF